MGKRDFAICVVLAIFGVAAGCAMTAWAILNPTASHALLSGLLWGGIGLAAVCLALLVVLFVASQRESGAMAKDKKRGGAGMRFSGNVSNSTIKVGKIRGFDNAIVVDDGVTFQNSELHLGEAVGLCPEEPSPQSTPRKSSVGWSRNYVLPWLRKDDKD